MGERGRVLGRRSPTSASHPCQRTRDSGRQSGAQSGCPHPSTAPPPMPAPSLQLPGATKSTRLSPARLHLCTSVPLEPSPPRSPQGPVAALPAACLVSGPRQGALSGRLGGRLGRAGTRGCTH